MDDAYLNVTKSMEQWRNTGHLNRILNYIENTNSNNSKSPLIKTLICWLHYY